MIRRKSLLGAVVATALAGGIWAGPALTAQASGIGTATEVAAVVSFDASEDGADLLGPGLLGLDAETVRSLTQADPGFASRVSSGLRSSDPYVIEATLDEISAHLAEAQVSSQTQSVTTHIVLDHYRVMWVAPRSDQNLESIAIAVHISDKTDSQQLMGSALLSQGLEREQLVSAIHTALSEE